MVILSLLSDFGLHDAYVAQMKTVIYTICPDATIIDITHEVEKLKSEEMADIFHHLGQSIRILKEAFRPMGFNIGMNLGQVAGAGVLHHLHFHIIPRWKGDMNFMPALCEVRIIPEHLEQTYDRLRPYFARLQAPKGKP